MRFFEIGRHVAARDYRGQNKWMDGEISARLGSLMYEIKTEAGSYWRRHVDQIRETSQKDTKTTDCLTDINRATEISTKDSDQCGKHSTEQVSPIDHCEDSTEPIQSSGSQEKDERNESVESGRHRYPRRERKAPERYIEQYS